MQLGQTVLLMIEHFVFGSIPLSAERAEESAPAGVQFHVNIVIRLTSEAFRANRTLERFLTDA